MKNKQALTETAIILAALLIGMIVGYLLHKPKPETPIDRSREIDSLKTEIADMRNIRLNDSLRAKVEVRADTLQKQMKRKEKPTHDSLVMKEWFRWISINKQIDK